MYNRASEFWQMLLNVFRVTESGRFTGAAPVGGGRAQKGVLKWAQFWSAHQRFFRQMLLSAKVGEGKKGGAGRGAAGGRGDGWGDGKLDA